MDNQLFTLYIRYLTGRCNREEFLEMKARLSSSTDEEVAHILDQAWESGLEFPSMKPESKNRIKANLFMMTRSGNKQYKRRIMWAAVAAVSLILILSGSLVYLSTTRSDVYQNPLIVNIQRGQKATIDLPDNSQVHINAGTTLEYDLTDTKNRRVYLSGEAYFDVSRDDKHPFIVELGDLQINVLGTSFNVRAHKDEDLIYTSLVEGSIRLKHKNTADWQYLSPAQQFIYSKKDGTSRIVPFDNDVELGWMNDRLVFNSEPLHRIIQRIERWYGVDIDLQCTEIGDDRMSGTFYDEELIDVMNAISIQYKVNYTIKGKNILITKDNQ